MFLKNFLLAACLVASVANASAQGDFCTSLHTLVTDAGNKFTLSRGNTLKADPRVVIWSCKTKVPGVISARIVSSMGVFYEGALFQTTSKDALKEQYNTYAHKLQDCLGKIGYSQTMADNFAEGTQDFKKLIYMKDDTKSDTPPPHLALEADYNKDTKNYTLILFLYEQ